MIRHLVFAVRNVNNRPHISAAVLGIGTGYFETLGINSTSQGIPERVFDHSGESVDRILSESSFVKHNSLPAEVTSESELLEEIGKHVSPSHIEEFVLVRAGRTERDEFGAGIVNRDLEAAHQLHSPRGKTDDALLIGVFLLEDDPHSLLDIDQESSRSGRGDLISRSAVAPREEED